MQREVPAAVSRRSQSYGWPYARPSHGTPDTHMGKGTSRPADVWRLGKKGSKEIKAKEGDS